MIITELALSQTNFQPAFIITENGDTVSGFIDYRGETKNSAICKFSKSKNGSPAEYLPASIRGYKFYSGKFYVSKQFQIEGANTWVFAELLFEGIYSIYFYRKNRNIYYFIEDKDRKIWELKNQEIRYRMGGKEYSKMSKEFISTLKVLFADYSEIQTEIQEADRSHKSLISLTKSYHEYVCPDEECIVYEENLPKALYRISPILGVNISMINLSQYIYKDFKFENSPSPLIGILFNTSIPRFNQKLSLEIGAAFCQNYFASTFSQGDYWKQHYDLYLKTYSLLNNLSFQYTFPTGKLRPFISLGGSLLLHLKQETQLINENESDFEVRSYENDYQVLPQSLLGFMVDLGITGDIWIEKEWFVKLFYSLNSGKHWPKDSIEIQTNMRSTGLCAGIMF